MSDPPSNPYPNKNAAIKAVLDHESTLEQYLKKYNFQDTICKCSALVRHRSLQYPLHEVLRIAEASCIYKRGHRDLVLTYNDFAKIINCIKQFADPLELNYLINTDGFYHFFLTLERKQMQLQNETNKARLNAARACYIHNSQRMDRFWIACEKELSISRTGWLTTMLCLWASFDSKPNPVYASMPDGLHGIPATEVGNIISTIGKTAEQLRQIYHNTRSNDVNSPLLWSTIRNSFWENPILFLDDHKIIAPFAPLVSRFMLYNPISIMPHLKREYESDFGFAHQYLVQDVLSDCFPGCVYNIDRIKNTLGDNPSPDFLITTDEFDLLIEVKTTTDTRIPLISSEITTKPLAEQLIKGYIQVCNGATILTKIKTSLGIQVNKKPLLGAVIIPDDNLLANTTWYVDKLFKPNLTNHGLLDSLETFHTPPQVLSVHSLEALCNLRKNQGISITSLFSEQHQRNMDIRLSDWTNHLMSYDPICWKPSPITHNAFDKLFEQITSKN